MEIDLFLNLEIAEECLQYETDEQYQDVFRRFFRIESESDDYDEECVYEGMSCILGKTLESEAWRQLYVKAAGQFLSEDPELGLPVLLSFTYFAKFFQLFRHSLEKGEDEVFEEQLQTLMTQL